MYLSIYYLSIHICQQTLQTKQNRIVDDPFIMTYVEELRRRMREQVCRCICMCVCVCLFRWCMCVWMRVYVCRQGVCLCFVG